MEEALNAQINAEFWSAYLYLSMSVAAAAKGHKGVANWFSVQFKEEQAHAQIFMNYLLSRGGRVVLAPLPRCRPNGLRCWRCSATRWSTSARSPH